MDGCWRLMNNSRIVWICLALCSQAQGTLGQNIPKGEKENHPPPSERHLTWRKHWIFKEYSNVAPAKAKRDKRTEKQMEERTDRLWKWSLCSAKETFMLFFSEGSLTLLLLAMFQSRHHDLFLWTIQLSKIPPNRKQPSQRKLNWSSDKQLSPFLQSDKHQMLTVLTTKSWQCIQAVTATFLYNGTWR